MTNEPVPTNADLAALAAKLDLSHARVAQLLEALAADRELDPASREDAAAVLDWVNRQRRAQLEADGAGDAGSRHERRRPLAPDAGGCDDGASL